MHTWRGHSISYFFLLFQGCQAVIFPIVIKGCGMLQNAFQIDVPHANPIECLLRCNKTNVGIQNATCYCGDFATAAQPYINCNQQCKWEEEGIDFSCGGIQFSVYSRGAIINEGTTGQNGCVLMRSEREFRVENCSSKYSCLCDGDPFKSMGTTFPTNNWTQCGKSCIEESNMFAFTEGKQYCLNSPCNIDRWISAYVYNECSPNPCRNNGSCTNTDFGFNCSCPSGFQGNTCEQVLNYTTIESTVFLPVSDSFVQPSNYETYSLSPSSTLTSPFIIDCSAVITGICSQSASSDSRFMLTVNSSASPTISSLSLASSSSDGSKIPQILQYTSNSNRANIIHLSVTSTQTGTVHLFSSVLASSSATGTTIPPPALSTPTVKVHLSSYSKTSSSISNSIILPTASIEPTATITTYSPGPSFTSTPALPSAFSAAASSPTGRVYLSSSNSVTSFVTSTAMTPKETSNQSDTVSAWISEHAIIIFPICGAVIVLLVVIIIIICVKMRRMKQKNDEMESEIMDTPSNSEFDYKTSFSYSQRPDNFYPSYQSAHYTYKEVPQLGPSQHMYLPRVSTRPAGSFPRYNRGYEDHAI